MKTEQQASRLISRAVKAYGDRVPELLVVLGSLKKLPKKATKPPPWVYRLLVLKVMKGPLNYINELKLRGRKTYTLAEIGKLLGIISGAMTFLVSPPKDTLKEEREFPPFRALRDGIAQKAIELTPRLIKRRKSKRISFRSRKKSRTKRTPFTSLQKVQFEFGYNEGLRRVLDENGKLAFEEQITYEICYVTWLFWPEVKDLSKVRELHAWLTELSGQRFTVKLVEKICREIGLKLGPRGRPAKKFLPGLSPA